jgi:hypothetical protein
MKKAVSREEALQKRMDRVLEQWEGSGQRGFLRELIEGAIKRMGMPKKTEAMILGRRIEDREGSWELWFDVQYAEEGLRKQAVICKGKYQDPELARREMARWPVGSIYRY